MAVSRRTGGNSFIVIGEQRKRGVYIDNFNPFKIGAPQSISGFSLNLGTDAASDTIAKNEFSNGGNFIFTVPANAHGTFTVSGEDDDGNTLTETIEVTASSEAQTIPTTCRYVDSADVTVTTQGTGSGTIATVDYQEQQAAFMFQNKLPFTRFTLDGDGDQAQSESIVGGGADTLNTPGLIGASGLMEAEILPQEIIQFMTGLLNPDCPPISEKVHAFTVGLTAASNEVRADGAYTLEQELITPALKTAKKNTPEWPAKLKATLSGFTGTGTMEIVGFRKVGRPNDEKFPVKKTIAIDTSDSLIVEADIFWTEVTSAKISGLTSSGTPANDKVKLEFDTGTYRTDVSLNTRNLLFEGWTLQGSKGGMPIIGLDVTPASGEININQNIRILLNMLASQVINNRLLTDINAEVLKFDPTTAPDNFPVVALDFFPAWGGAFFFDMDIEPTAFTNLTLGINQNLVPSQGYTGSRKRGEPIVDDNAVRQVGLNWTGYFESGDEANDKFHRWQEYYRDNDTAPVYLNLFNYLSNGKQFRILFEGAQFQLTEFPTLAIESRGQIPEQLTGKIVPAVGSSTDEIKVSVWSDFDYQEKFYV